MRARQASTTAQLARRHLTTRHRQRPLDRGELEWVLKLEFVA